MIVIVGESASGKSTVAETLSSKYGFKRIITYTTRPPRHYEEDGKDYYFKTDSQYKDLKDSNYFAETAEYNGWCYASAKCDYDADAVIVLTPNGLRQIRSNGVQNIFSVYLNVPRRDRIIKCLQRGDDIEETYRRSLSDVGQFDGVENEVDFVINNTAYICHPNTIAEMIVEKYNARS